MSGFNTFAPSDTAFTPPARLPGRRQLIDVLGAALRRHPAATLACIDDIAWAGSACGLLGPAPEAIRRLHGPSLVSSPTEVAWRSAALRIKNHAAVGLIRRYGLGAFAALVDERSALPPASLTRCGPAILISSHIGVHNGVTAVLHRWGVHALALPAQDVGRPQGRAAALRQAVDTLRGGGLVLAAIDGPLGAHTAPVICFGRHIVLRRGAFALARLTGAPLRPIAVQWTSNGAITPVVADPLPMGTCHTHGEHALAAAAAHWIETYLRNRPEDAWPYTISNLLAAPPAKASPDSTTNSARR